MSYNIKIKILGKDNNNWNISRSLLRPSPPSDVIFTSNSKKRYIRRKKKRQLPESSDKKSQPSLRQIIDCSRQLLVNNDNEVIDPKNSQIIGTYEHEQGCPNCQNKFRDCWYFVKYF